MSSPPRRRPPRTPARRPARAPGALLSPRGWYLLGGLGLAALGAAGVARSLRTAPADAKVDDVVTHRTDGTPLTLPITSTAEQTGKGSNVEFNINPTHVQDSQSRVRKVVVLPIFYDQEDKSTDWKEVLKNHPDALVVFNDNIEQFKEFYNAVYDENGVQRQTIKFPPGAYSAGGGNGEMRPCQIMQYVPAGKVVHGCDFETGETALVAGIATGSQNAKNPSQWDRKTYTKKSISHMANVIAQNPRIKKVIFFGNVYPADGKSPGDGTAMLKFKKQGKIKNLSWEVPAGYEILLGVRIFSPEREHIRIFTDGILSLGDMEFPA